MEDLPRRSAGAIATGLVLVAGMGPTVWVQSWDWSAGARQSGVAAILLVLVFPLVIGASTRVDMPTRRQRVLRAAATHAVTLFLAFLGTLYADDSPHFVGPAEIDAFKCAAMLWLPAMIATVPIGEWAADPAEEEDEDASLTMAIGLWLSALAYVVLLGLALLYGVTVAVDAPVSSVLILLGAAAPAVFVFVVGLFLVVSSLRRKRRVHAFVDAVLRHEVSGFRIRAATSEDDLASLPAIVSGRLCDGVLESVELPAQPFRERSATARALRRAPLRS